MIWVVANVNEDDSSFNYESFGLCLDILLVNETFLYNLIKGVD